MPGQPLTLLEMIDILNDTLGTEVAVDHVKPRVGGISHRDADSSRLYELFPGTEPTPFRDGLAATIDWFRKL